MESIETLFGKSFKITFMKNSATEKKFGNAIEGIFKKPSPIFKDDSSYAYVAIRVLNNSILNNDLPVEERIFLSEIGVPVSDIDFSHITAI